MTESALKEPKDTTLLVVDDEGDLREAIMSFLKRRGYRVLGAENGREALAILERGEPVDLVLTDVRMPNGDGIELLDRVKKRSHVTPVVILITGYADLTIEEAFDRGADAVFSKPFDRKELLEAIRRALTQRENLWAERPEMIPVDFEIELEFSDLNLATTGRALNIGRGGMFVALRAPLPTPGVGARFRILFGSDPAFQTLAGEGIVRWARTNAQEGLPIGCGIEFGFIEETARARLIDFIERHSTRAFIPKI
ncbi:MAG: response regulator [Deltaproteobacteria bacterium]|nr:response regulator [Deltaproteobacteria bacterium]